MSLNSGWRDVCKRKEGESGVSKNTAENEPRPPVRWANTSVPVAPGDVSEPDPEEALRARGAGPEHQGVGS